MGFSSNLYFHFSGQNMTLNGLYKPFCTHGHYQWRNSIIFSFQFYFLIFKYFNKNLLSVLIILFIISFLLAEFGSKNFPSLNFYFLPTRIWELVAGSLISYFEIKNKIPKNNLILNSLFPSLGILLILFSAIFFDHSFRHPSIYTLIPILGVVFIICFSNMNEFTYKILSSKIFVGVGLISYSLYLWHYPIFAFSRITEITSGDISKKILLGVIILILSTLTYFFIENYSNCSYFIVYNCDSV